MAVYSTDETRARQVLVNAQTGQVESSQKQMSGNATYQDLAR
jgi:hypothetical protein